MSIVNSITGYFVNISSNTFLDQVIGLWTLIALIPLIILYLIRPKPKRMEMPSLMFFMKTRGRSVLKSFLRHILKDILFFAQMLIVILIAVSVSMPYSHYEHDITAANTIIVLDASASMQVKEGVKTRFDIAKEYAAKYLGKQNTLIVAKNTMYLALQNEKSEDVLRYLKTLNAVDTPSKIGEAIILAGEILKGGEGKIFVISDFINTEGMNPATAKAVVESKGMNVEFVNVGSNDRSNIGIVDLQVKEDVTTMFVKNYDSIARTVKFKVNYNADSLEIPAESVESYSFQTPRGETTIELQTEDDFAADNLAYISTPTNPKIRVNLITSDKSKFLETALTSSQFVEVEVSVPPIIGKGEYDVYIIHNIDPAQILPGTFKDILEKVEDGAAVIVHAQDKMNQINYAGLLPFDVLEKEYASPLIVQQKNSFTKNIDFGTPKQYYKTSKSAMYDVVTAENSTIIGYKQHGLGALFYYGILEDASDFKLSPYYPIFWNEVLKFLTGQESLTTVNKKTGETIIFEGKIQGPDGVAREEAAVLEKKGFYRGKQIIASSLLNEKESQINLQNQEAKKILDIELKDTTEMRKFYYLPILVLLAMFLLLIELWIIRGRGDI